MNIGITGATGFIGRHIIDLALRSGHEIIAFSRSPERTIPGCEMRRFSLIDPPDIRGCEAIIHLAGESVIGLWTPAKKRRIAASRRDGTCRVVEAINGSSAPPEVLVSGSATGFYGDHGELEISEASAAGSGFLADTVRSWEAQARLAERTRVVLLRTSLVLGKDGGALKWLTPIFRARLGARLGTGRQWMPWIHIEDEARLALFAVANMDLSGPLNAAASSPVRNGEFTESLARALHRRAFLRIPSFVFRLLGEVSRELLESKKVVPGVAAEHGFGFRYPELQPAFDDLFG